MKMQKLLSTFLLLSLLLTSGCALLRKKPTPVIRQPIQLESIVKYLGDPNTNPVFVQLNPDTTTTLDLLQRGYNLVQVVDEADQIGYRSNFAEYSDARLRLIDFMQGKMGEIEVVSGILMDESRLGRPVGIRQNREMIERLYINLAKNGTLFYFHYTSGAEVYGKKPSTFNSEEIIDLLRFKFSQVDTDSSSIPGIHLLKFTK